VAAAVAAGVGLAAAGLLGGRYLWTPPEPAAPVTAAVAAPAPAPPPDRPPPTTPPPDPLAVLSAAESAASARQALASVLAAWGAAPLSPDEDVASASFARVATRHDLEHVLLKANASMLRLLDVPAVLELHLPGGGPRFVALTGVDDDGYHLAVGDAAVVVSDDFLSDVWYGQAHVFWRDTQRLGPDSLGAGTSGERVGRLQQLLATAGSYDGPRTGTFDAGTERAVRSFQRSYFLEPDGLVGPITRLALHSSAGDDARPSLVQAGTAP
jgi:general secretion pathway protein A